jgi:Zn-dependent protease
VVSQNGRDNSKNREATLELLTLLIPLAIALAAGFGLTVFITAVKVNRVRLRPMTVERVDLLAVPATARAILEPGRAWLMARDFRYVSSFRLDAMIAGPDGDVRYGDLYVEQSRAVFAAVMPREAPQPGDTTNIEFQSVFADGRCFATVNRMRHTMVWESPEWSFQDHYLADPAQVLERHLAWVARAGGGVPVADIELRDRVSRERVVTFVDQLVDAKVASRSPNGETRIRFMAGLRYVVKLLVGNSRAAKVKPVSLGPVSVATGAMGQRASVAADLNAYQARRTLEGAMSSQGKWKIGVLSAAAFLAVGAWLWDWRYALFVLLVIALHEGGHYLAMKWVGYRNLHVFFLPGLGGLATGEKQDASAAQKVFVYLAGPVPGIVLATTGLLALPAVDAFPDAQTFLMVMLVINLINLLPVTPLDGGRVMEVLLFARWPLMRMLFAAASCTVLLGFGALTGDRVMLVIGVLVAFSMPSQWRLFRLARRVKRNPGVAYDEQAAARRVFGALNQPGFARWNMQQRASVADQLIAELRTPVPRFGGIVAGLAIYAATFAAPAAAALIASPWLHDAVDALIESREEMASLANGMPGAAQRDWLGEIAASREAAPEVRLPLLLGAAEDGMLYEPDRREELKRLASARPSGDLLRVRATLVDLRDPRGEDDVVPALRALREQASGEDEESRRIRARIDATLAFALPRSEEKIRLLVESRDALRALAPGDPALPGVFRTLAQEREAAGDIAGAEAELVAAVASAGERERAPFAAFAGARADQLAFLVRQGRWAEAQAVARPPAEAALASTTARRRNLLYNLQAVHAMFWMSVHAKDGAEAARWLAAWQDALPRQARANNPGFVLARLALADLRGDRGSVSAAREDLLKPKMKVLCEPYGALPVMRDSPLDAHRTDLLSRHGVCAAA